MSAYTLCIVMSAFASLQLLASIAEPHHVSMTPQEIVHELDKHIIGQDAAKRAVAIALRNRWRRQQVDEIRCGRRSRRRIS